MRWNEAKYRVLKVMEYRRQQGLNNSISAFQLAGLSGVERVSLECLLPRWVRWQYISRVKTKFFDEMIVYHPKTKVVLNYRYHLILFKGLKWIEWFELWYPDLANDYFKRLDEHLQWIESSGPVEF